MTASSSMLTETQLKCSSLPPGLAGPGSSTNRLNRSKSNAGSQSQDPLDEDDEAHEEKKKEDSFFGRFFGRQSGKKKKSKEETSVRITTTNTSQTFTSKTETGVTTSSTKPIEDRRPYSVDPFMIRTGGLIKSGPSSRQRVQPIDIPISPELERHQQRSPDLHLHTLPPKSPEKPYAPSGIPANSFHSKLEQHIKQRTNSSSTSPPKQQEPLTFITSLPPTIPTQQHPQIHSASPPKSLWTSPESSSKPTSLSTTRYFETRMDDSRNNKMKLAGLSSLQQRVLSHNDHDDSDPDDTGFKSLTDFPLEPEIKKANVTKSHSFKSVIKSSTSDGSICTLKPSFNAPIGHSIINPNIHSNMNPIVSQEETNLDSLSSVGASKDTESFETTIKPDIVENISGPMSMSMSLSLDSIEDDVVEPKIEFKRSASNESVYSNHSSKHFKTDRSALEQVSPSEITISCGPQSILASPQHHTSIVNIGAQETVKMFDKTSPERLQPKEQPLVTKIQVKRDSNLVPEFFNVQLNKVDHKPSTTVVLSTSSGSITSPVIVEEKTKLKQKEDKETAKTEADVVKRKFSAENMEIIDKDSAEEVCIEVQKRMFKKHSETVNNGHQQRKSSLVSVTSASNPESPTSPTKPYLKKKSYSLEVVDAIKKTSLETSLEPNNSRNVLDKSESTGNVFSKILPSPDIIAEAPVEVVLRRKSLAKQRQDEEPELMKVFARRSLKLKDSDVDALNQQVLDAVEAEDKQNFQKSRDSDKENDAMESPPEERKVNSVPKIKEPLVETKDLPDVVLRKSIGNNKFNAFSRAVSLNSGKTNENNLEKFHKQNSLNEQRPKTEISPVGNEKILNKSWLNSVKQKEAEIIEATEKIPLRDDLSDMVVQKSDFINEDFTAVKTKNFNQRKAEWEQRAQQALKKNTP